MQESSKVKAFMKVYVLLKVSVSDGSFVKSTTVCVTCAGTGVCVFTDCTAVCVIPVFSMCAPHTQYYSVSGPDTFCLIVIALTESDSCLRQHEERGNDPRTDSSSVCPSFHSAAALIRSAVNRTGQTRTRAADEQLKSAAAGEQLRSP